MMPPLTGPVLTAAEMRAAEAAAMAAGLSVDTLMDRAGHALAQAVWRFGGGCPVLVLCGPGNNGGDGYVAARAMRALGLDVRVAALAPPTTDVAQRAAATWTGEVEDLVHAAPSALVLDCLFGTGLSRPLDPECAAQLDRLIRAARFVVAADLPSGVGSDDGALLGAAPVQLTVALGALKPAHLLQPAAALCGHVIVADIGVAAQSQTHVLPKPQLAVPTPQDHKFSRGLVTVVAGAMPGAALLSASAAARSGAGYVVLAGGQSGAGAPLSLVHRPIEAALADPRLAALVIGPGLGRSDAAKALLAKTLALPVPVVVDADALHLVRLDHLTARSAPTLLTPHAGEFAALFGAQKGSKIDQAQSAAQASGCGVIFKGADTVVALPDGTTWVAAGASAWLASAGTGDVLAGIAGTMLARGLDASRAAQASVWLHNRAASLAGPGLIADDLLGCLAPALAMAR